MVNAIKPFVLRERMNTGIDQIDQQHRHLIDLVNKLIELDNLGGGVKYKQQLKKFWMI